MTALDLLAWIDAHPLPVVGLLFLPPVLTALLGFAHAAGEGGRGWTRWAYAGLVYATCVLGVPSTLVALYTLLFTGTNLLGMGLVSTVLPVVAMAATLVKMAQQVNFEELPGFERIAGLITLIAVTFGVLWVLQRMRIWLVFHAPIAVLLGAAVTVFAVLRWAAYTVGRRSDQPPEPPPKIS